jgi:hypothetical protein
MTDETFRLLWKGFGALLIIWFLFLAIGAGISALLNSEADRYWACMEANYVSQPEDPFNKWNLDHTVCRASHPQVGDYEEWNERRRCWSYYSGDSYIEPDC